MESRSGSAPEDPEDYIFDSGMESRRGRRSVPDSGMDPEDYIFDSGMESRSGSAPEDPEDYIFHCRRCSPQDPQEWNPDLAPLLRILRTTSSTVEWNPDLALLLRILRTTSSIVEWNPDLALLLRILRTTSSTVEWNPEGEEDLSLIVAWIL